MRVGQCIPQVSYIPLNWAGEMFMPVEEDAHMIFARVMAAKVAAFGLQRWRQLVVLILGLAVILVVDLLKVGERGYDSGQQWTSLPLGGPMVFMCRCEWVHISKSCTMYIAGMPPNGA